MRKFLAILIISSFLLTTLSGCVAKNSPLNVIVVFHNHQPFYKDVLSNEYTLPWVRLHGAKDYYRMPYIVSQYPDIHITFDLSGSLITQLNDYINGAEDTSLKLAKIDPTKLSVDEKFQMLSVPGGFFDINWDHIVKKVPVYTDLLNKRDEAFQKFSVEDKSTLTSYLTAQDYLNLQTLFNLFWLDTDYIKQDKELSPIFDKAYSKTNYTVEERNLVLKKQFEIIGDIFAMYSDLMKKNQIELVSTPYAHPISPLLVDFGLDAELDRQLKKSLEVFKETFDSTPNGIWTSECALNDESLKIIGDNGFKWTISDADNLTQLGVNKDEPSSRYVPYKIGDVNVFFRDKYLSDGISFRYSGKSVDEAVKDVEDTLTQVQKLNTKGNLVYTIALDGENAWEYYENDGNDFLKAFYAKLTELQKQGIINVVTPSEYLKKFSSVSVQEHKVTALSLENQDISNISSYSNLPKKEYDGYFGESSWVNPTLDTWVGEPQENVGWMWLIKFYEKYSTIKQKFSLDKQNKVDDLLLMAEGSDWFWWYGSDQSSGNDKGFDRLYKLYLAGCYQEAGLVIPDYLFGNFFPDGEPYVSSDVSLKENTPQNVLLLDKKRNATFNYTKNHIEITLPSNNFIVAVYNSKTLRTFLSEQSAPTKFNILEFPYDKSSIGMPVDFEIYGTNNKYILDLTNLDLNRLYVCVASATNGSVKGETNPLKVKLPMKITGELVGELYDDVNDDFGPGTYTYPLNEIFKNRGHLFDLVSFKMYDAGDNYLLQYEMSSLGDNPWNGPNGFSFQILETYFDVNAGGKTEPIDIAGPNVQIDQAHPWDIAIRVAGWSYGNYITDSQGNSYSGELGISVDNEKNTILVTLPKKYLQIDPSYKPYICIISGNQDGYGGGYFRAVNATASEWACGGGDPDAISAGVLPKVIDIFVAKSTSQKDILTSFDVSSKKLAVVPMLPLAKAPNLPNLIASYKLNIPNVTPPSTKFSCEIEIKNNGKGDSLDLEGPELTLSLPQYVKVISYTTSSGKLSLDSNVLNFNGEIKSNSSTLINVNMSLMEDVPNGYKEVFNGIVRFDGDGTNTHSVEKKFEFSFFVKYKVVLELPFDSNYLIRNGVKIPFKDSTSKIVFRKEFNDISVPLEDFCLALGCGYKFDGKKVTITFLDNKYEHWVGQNKSLLNGTAVPLIEGNSEVRSFLENGNPILPVKALANSFKFEYNIDSVNKKAVLSYLP